MKGSNSAVFTFKKIRNEKNPLKDLIKQTIYYRYFCPFAICQSESARFINVTGPETPNSYGSWNAIWRAVIVMYLWPCCGMLDVEHW